MTDNHIEKDPSEEGEIDPILQEEDRKEQNKRGFESRKKPQIDVDDLVSKITEKVSATLSNNASKDIIEDELSKFDPEDREAIRKEYNDTIKQTGHTRQDIQNDLKKASLLANPEKIRQIESEHTASEIANSTKGRSASSGATSYANNDSSKKFDYKKVLSQAEIDFGKSRGWTEDRFELAAKRVAGIAPDNRPK